MIYIRNRLGNKDKIVCQKTTLFYDDDKFLLEINASFLKLINLKNFKTALFIVSIIQLLLKKK